MAALFNRIIPILFVSDLEAERDFYVRLGFHVTYEGPEYPHFLALGLDMLPSERADEYRAEGMPVVAWTTRAPAEWDKVSAHCDNHIFEGFAA